jgi:hypothetical protein
MIRLTVILLTCSILFACHSTNPQPGEPSKPIASTTTNFKTLDTVVPFAGFWVNETYVNNIKQTQSPRKCQNLLESCITIPGRTLQTTSMVSGFHDGAGEMVVVKKDNTFQFYYKYNDTIRDLAYDIKVISPEKLKIGKNTFIKTNEAFLADILFSGEYLDSLGNTVQFSKDGDVKGLPYYTGYFPMYDYTTEEDLGVDQLTMSRNHRGTHLGFKFSKDTLFIYNLNCAQTDSSGVICLKFALGDIKFKLIRKH